MRWNNNTIMTRSPNARAVPMDNDALRRAAAAAFAIAPHSSRGERYSFLPTIEVVDALRGAGWQPVFAAQGKTREESRNGVQRHVIRFRHPDMSLSALAKVGDLSPELVLLNSHDGASAFQLHAGMFRLVCGNGLIVADSTFAKVSIRHTSTTVRDVVDASFRVIADVPQIGASVESMRAVDLSDSERRVFAEAATKLRWEDDAAPVIATDLLTPRRYEDKSPNLWSTLNTVQENLVRGGLRGKTSTGKRTHTRGIGSVAEDTKINKALWHLAEEMRKLKSVSA